MFLFANFAVELECIVQEINRLLSRERLGQTIVPKKNYRFWTHMEVFPEFHTSLLTILTLKMLFGLDDLTERYQSDFARTVNGILQVS
jgi:hypothetical protein